MAAASLAASRRTYECDRRLTNGNGETLCGIGADTVLRGDCNGVAARCAGGGSAGKNARSGERHTGGQRTRFGKGWSG